MTPTTPASAASEPTSKGRPTAAELHPGASHPQGPLSLTELAQRFALDDARLSEWCAAGLPVLSDGRVDPFTACNWISWNRLAEAPALRRAWRGYLLVFAGFLAGNPAPRTLTWHRSQRLYLPHAATRVRWWVPRAQNAGPQRVLADDGLAGLAFPAGRMWQVREATAIQGTVRVQVAPVSTADPVIADLLESELIRLAAEFCYEYRHHRVSEPLACEPTGSPHGSCLDAARWLHARLRHRGLEGRIVAGIIAHDSFANPHFWVEGTAHGRLWVADPTLPAIARMLGADWRAVARAYAGACDARRVRLTSQPLADATVASAIGEVEVDGANAWSCLDWVCGDCQDWFTTM